MSTLSEETNEGFQRHAKRGLFAPILFPAEMGEDVFGANVMWMEGAYLRLYFSSLKWGKTCLPCLVEM